MRSLVENAQISFKQQVANLKIDMGLNNEGLAKLLGCSTKTVGRLVDDPFTVSGRYILMVQEYLRKEERKRYE